MPTVPCVLVFVKEESKLNYSGKPQEESLAGAVIVLAMVEREFEYPMRLNVGCWMVQSRPTKDSLATLGVAKNGV
jgi:hypothetical protein